MHWALKIGETSEKRVPATVFGDQLAAGTRNSTASGLDNLIIR